MMINIVYACLVVIAICVAGMVLVMRACVDAVCHAQTPSNYDAQAFRPILADLPPARENSDTPPSVPAPEIVDLEPPVNMPALSEQVEAGYQRIMSGE